MTEKLANILDDLSQEERDYVLNGLLENIAHRGDAEKFCLVLSDYDYIRSKIELFGVEPLIDDYKMAESSHLNLDKDTREGLRLIQSALVLSKDIIASDKTKTITQLETLLLHQENPIVQRLFWDMKSNDKRTR